MLTVKQLPLQQTLKCVFISSQKSRPLMGEFFCLLLISYGVEESKISVATVKANCSHCLKIP